tara:strand:- start:80 stop:349 length:270 start_codon:yes stop_codon:yes gene_type:complete
MKNEDFKLTTNKSTDTLKLYDTDYVRVVDGKLADELDTIYAESSLIDMLADMKDNGGKLADNEKYVSMTSLTQAQQKLYLDYLKFEKSN